MEKIWYVASFRQGEPTLNEKKSAAKRGSRTEILRRRLESECWGLAAEVVTFLGYVAIRSGYPASAQNRSCCCKDGHRTTLLRC